MQMPVLPILTIFIAGVIWFTTFMRRASRIKEAEKKSLEEYLELEQEANFSKSKEIDEKLFIKMDISPFLLDGYKEVPPELSASEKAFRKAADKKMLRFDTKMSNREIKLKYGASNFELMAGYEQNLTNYFIAGNFYCENLIKYNYDNMAQGLLKEMIKQTSDISKTYTLLADVLHKKNNKSELKNLKEIVENSDMQLKAKIISHIEGLGVSQ